MAFLRKKTWNPQASQHERKDSQKEIDFKDALPRSRPATVAPWPLPATPFRTYNPPHIGSRRKFIAMPEKRVTFFDIFVHHTWCCDRINRQNLYCIWNTHCESYHFISVRFIYSGLGAPIYISMPACPSKPSKTQQLTHKGSSSVFFTISDRLLLICSCGSIGKADGATWSHFQSIPPGASAMIFLQTKKSPHWVVRVIWENFPGSGSTELELCSFQVRGLLVIMILEI